MRTTQSSGKRLSSFEFYTDYVNKEKALQPEYYAEVERILTEEISGFHRQFNRKPVVLDIGSAGIIPYKPESVERGIICDLFDKPSYIELPANLIWIKGNILSVSTLEDLVSTYKVDIIIVSSVLHHLCDERNNELANVDRFFKNIKKFNGAKCFIFESIAPSFLAKLQDIVWPIQSFILNRIIGFTNVRMLSLKELNTMTGQNGLHIQQIDFRQPKYIAQFFFKVPLALYPLRIIAMRIDIDM